MEYSRSVAADFAAHYREMWDEVGAVLERTLKQGHLFRGPEDEELEAALAGYLGGDCLVVAVSSATDAILIALQATGERDYEVLTVGNVCPAVTAAVRSAGADLAYVDVRPEDFLMDVSQLEQAITPRTRVILAVHLHGVPVDMDEVNRVAAKHGLRVIEDAAQGLGATYRGRPAGRLGDVGCLSFHPTKVLPGIGFGGAIVTRDEDIAAAARRLRWYGRTSMDGPVVELGLNRLMQQVNAAVVRHKLKYLDGWARERGRKWSIYAAELEGTPVRLQMVPEDVTIAPVWGGALAPDRDELLAKLKAAGFPCGNHYPVPLYDYPPFKPAAGAVRLPHTDACCRQALTLPLYPEYPDSEIRRLCAFIRRAIGE